MEEVLYSIGISLVAVIGFTLVVMLLAFIAWLFCKN